MKQMQGGSIKYYVECITVDVVSNFVSFLTIVYSNYSNLKSNICPTPFPNCFFIIYTLLDMELDNICCMIDT